MLSFHNVAFLAEEQDGICEFSCRINATRRYCFQTHSQQQSEYLCGLLEGRLGCHSGIVRQHRRYFCQSDRWFLQQEKIITRHPKDWLNLKSPYTANAAGRTAKLVWLDRLGRSSFSPVPIYQLEAEEMLDFVLASLLFQESGLLILKDIFAAPLNPAQDQVLCTVLEHSYAAICAITCGEPPPLHTRAWEKISLQNPLRLNR